MNSLTRYFDCLVGRVSYRINLLKRGSTTLLILALISSVAGINVPTFTYGQDDYSGSEEEDSYSGSEEEDSYSVFEDPCKVDPQSDGCDPCKVDPQSDGCDP
ncbi:MAG: hypothetical protein WBX81_06565, partial [Nitrososphaeraceae archaeon]